MKCLSFSKFEHACFVFNLQCTTGLLRPGYWCKSDLDSLLFAVLCAACLEWVSSTHLYWCSKDHGNRKYVFWKEKLFIHPIKWKPIFCYSSVWTKQYAHLFRAIETAKRLNIPKAWRCILVTQKKLYLGRYQEKKCQIHEKDLQKIIFF